jgi:hypothetical protein
MRYWIFTCVFLCTQVVAFANSLTLFNDSPFVLNATIMGADGSNLGQFTIQPQNAAQWSNQFEQEGTYQDPSMSQTPYTVIWYCAEGTEYGISTGQAAGSYVMAQSSQGGRYCQPKKQQGPQNQQPSSQNNY